MKCSALEMARLRLAIGVELRRLRIESGLTLREVAERTGSHHPIIARIEQGHHIVTLETADRFARACGGSLLDVARVIDRSLELGGQSWR